jgi:hypothetical protein
MLCEYDKRNILGGKIRVIDLVIELFSPEFFFCLKQMQKIHIEGKQYQFLCILNNLLLFESVCKFQ